MGPQSDPIKILIADSHSEYRKALRITLELEQDLHVIAEADDWHSLMLAVRNRQPDIILMDIRMPDSHGNNNGITVTRHLLSRHPDIAVIIMTMLSSSEHVTMALQAGAKGYLLKDADHNEFLKIIRTITRNISANHLNIVPNPDHYADF